MGPKPSPVSVAPAPAAAPAPKDSKSIWQDDEVTIAEEIDDAGDARKRPECVQSYSYSFKIVGFSAVAAVVLPQLAQKGLAADVSPWRCRRRDSCSAATVL